MGAVKAQEKKQINGINKLEKRLIKWRVSQTKKVKKTPKR